MKPKRRLRLDDIVESGFVVLGEEPDRELVLGIVGKFWQLSSGVHRIEPDEFSGFDTPGFAKAAWNFVVSATAASGLRPSRPRPASLCTDDDARRRFSRYWWLIGRFSALIRRVMLRNIKREAESAKVG